MKSWQWIWGIVLVLTVTASANTARLQVIHNAADPAAAVVDVYVNDALLLDDFAFRAATPFIDVPAKVKLNIGIAPGNSTSAADTLKNFAVKFKKNRTYVAVANGVLDPSSFAANPDAREIGFTLFARDYIREAGSDAGSVDFVVLHGVTDAPAVDVLARDIATLVDNAAYGDFNRYISVPAAAYTLDITLADDNNAVVASYDADLSGLGGGAAIIFASGFLSPASNQNGAAFGIYAALPDGSVIGLPSAPLPVPSARLQVIHNSADPAAAEVDIYVNDGLLLDNFAFRTATPYIDVPAGVTLNIGVAPGSSASAADTLKNFAVQFENGGSYVAIANGVLDPAAFAANPEGRSTAFTLFARADAREEGSKMDRVDAIVLHGATDAPAVKINTNNLWIDAAAYGDIAGYFSLRAQMNTIDVKIANSHPVVRVGKYEADLTGLEGAAAVVFASGFVDPSANQNGAGFGLFAALPGGAVVELPGRQPAPAMARLQVIHNAADPAAAAVDVYINDALAIDDFAFRSATPFLDIPANVTLNIGVAPGNSTSAADTLKNFAVTLAKNKTYVAVANGVLDPSIYAPNPDGRSIGFTLFARDDVRESAKKHNMVDLLVLHGSSDAPTVDVIARGVATLVDDAAYGDFTNYISVPAGSYTLDITPGNDNSNVLFSYAADLSGLGGGAAIVFASGFVTPSANQNGAGFGIFAALADGTVIGLPAPAGGAAATLANGGSSSLDINSFDLRQNYPNPFNPSTTIAFSIASSERVNLTIYDIAGREVATLVNDNLDAGNHSVTFDASNLATGVYFYRIQAGSFKAIKRMMLVK